MIYWSATTAESGATAVVPLSHRQLEGPRSIGISSLPEQARRGAPGLPQLEQQPMAVVGDFEQPGGAMLFGALEMIMIAHSGTTSCTI
eukprot:SAG22_NODE_2211_length_2832_cov_2.111965_2_plen_88_part_00